MPSSLVTVYCDTCGHENAIPPSGICSESESPHIFLCVGCGDCRCGDCASEREHQRELEELEEEEQRRREYDEYDDDDDSPSDDGEREREPYSLPAPARVTTGALFLPALPGRPIRPMSFEQEIGRGRELAAEALYNGGFAPNAYVNSYGSSGSVAREHDLLGTFVHVETDSSCGGEIIYSRLNLNIDAAARGFEQAFGIVRDLHADEQVVLNARCGFHIHIGIQGFGMRAIENLYHAHNYLEDLLYRIGSANWRGHRSEMSDNHYAPTVEKNLTGKASIGHWLRHSRSGLNLSNYLASRANCQCGAFEFADWEHCSCNLPKATCEFRWPNATTNAHKVHCYASLLQALVACAESADDGAFARLPAMGFLPRSAVYPATVESWHERIEWIGENLQLTRTELDSLAYCVGRAPFGPIDDGHAEELAYRVARIEGAGSELVAL